jgi:hypothetical protein
MGAKKKEKLEDRAHLEGNLIPTSWVDIILSLSKVAFHSLQSQFRGQHLTSEERMVTSGLPGPP